MNYGNVMKLRNILMGKFSERCQNWRKIFLKSEAGVHGLTKKCARIYGRSATVQKRLKISSEKDF